MKLLIETGYSRSKARPSRVMQPLLMMMEDLTAGPQVYGTTPLSEHSSTLRSSTLWRNLVRKACQLLPSMMSL